MLASHDDCLFYRASLLSFSDDVAQPNNMSSEQCLNHILKKITYHEDGILIIKRGKIQAVGDYLSLVAEYNISEDKVNQKYRYNLIMPGFIDTHTHYPQSEMIASFGEQLLTWLEKYTFPTELKFHNKTYAKKIAHFFLKELFSNGTTTAMVFPTVHKQSTDALFEAADSYDMRLITGKVMMDRHAPEHLLDTPETSYQDSEALIQKWHKKDRLLYAITPRFALTSTDAQLHMAGQLKQKYPDTYVQTHLSETHDEIKRAKSLFPECKTYLDIYHKHHLVDKNAMFAHAIYLEDSELALLDKQKASVSFCPSSNLFLGSGLFNLRNIKSHNIPIGIGSDVGAGTSFSLLKTLSDAYKAVSLEQNGKDVPPFGAFEAFYQITLGASQSLGLEDKVGRLDKDYEADFVVIDWLATPLQNLRMQTIEDNYNHGFNSSVTQPDKATQIKKLAEQLFSLMILGDDRNILATYVNGKQVHARGF